MISLVLGALLGTVAVFGREMLRRGMSDPDSLEQNLDLAVYRTARSRACAPRSASRSWTPSAISW